MTTATSSTDTVVGDAAALGEDLPAEVWTEMLRGGDRVLNHSVHKSDVETEHRFIEALSPQSRRFRFLEALNSPSDGLKLTAINPLTDMAHVAVIGKGPQQREVGVTRFSAQAHGRDCEVAGAGGDASQGRGLGWTLMQRLIAAAGRLDIEEMHSTDLEDNNTMRQFAQQLHLNHRRNPDYTTN